MLNKFICETCSHIDFFFFEGFSWYQIKHVYIKGHFFELFMLIFSLGVDQLKQSINLENRDC